MLDSTVHLGDSHNFGRRVELRGDRIVKPRTLVWEELLLSAKSPLRRLLGDHFDFLPSLSFRRARSKIGGEVDRVVLSPLPRLSKTKRRELATIVGRAVALFSWLGLSDLHWENLVLGRDHRDRIVFGPLDVEMILADLELPTETKLLPDADPEVAEICRHAAGVRRALPYLGKPVDAGDLVAMASAYRTALEHLDRKARAIAEVFANLPGLTEAPIRVLLRGTDEYARADDEPLWPPLLDAEKEQLARGDVPYFFRLYGQSGIRYFADRSLATLAELPRRGDVPRLDPLLSIARHLRSPSRKKLREEGLLALVGAFDHPSFEGRHATDDLAIRFGARSIVVTPRDGDGDELHARRDLSAFVGSVYLPCRCGEVRSVFVPQVTRCDASRR